MEIIKQSWSFATPHIDGKAILRQIESAGRTCYKSEDMNALAYVDKTKAFVKSIMTKNHESVLEHVSISVRCITDRGVTHEMVRHRIASYSQESTRYCNYSKDKFGGEVQFILPVEFYDIHDKHVTMIPDEALKESTLMCYSTWKSSILSDESKYMTMLNFGATPQLARSVLPNCLKTEIVMTCNLREWRHFFKLRTAKAAHPQMRDLAISILKGFQDKIPVVFDDIKIE